MSSRRLSAEQQRAVLFAALADETRLRLVTKLASGRSCSIARLTEGTSLTRQAVAKHLRVLEQVHIVRGTRVGRENLFTFDPRPVNEMKAYLDRVSAQWDGALQRLKAFAERDE